MPALKYFTVPLGTGVNTRDPLMELKNDMTASQYWDYDREGGLTSRLSTFITLSTAVLGSANVPTKLWSVITTDGATAYLVVYCAGSGKVFTFISTDYATQNLLLTWTTTTKWMGADVLNGKLWMVNGADTPQSWDMTSATTTVAAVTNMPVARHICMYKNYCFVAGTTADPSRVFVSTTKDPTSWPTNNDIYVGKDDGDAITGMFGTPEGLMIFKQRSVWLWLGDTFDIVNSPLATRLIRLNTPNGVGGLGYSTASYMEGLGVIWMARDGVYAWNGQVVEKLSEKIQPTFELLSPYSVGYAATVLTKTFNNRREAQGTVFRGRYWLAVEQTSVTSLLRTVLVMDKNRRWQIIPDEQAMGFLSFADTTYINQLFVGLYGASTTGAVVEWDVRRSIGGASTVALKPGDATTGYLDFGDQTRLKHIRRAFAIYSTDDTNGTLTITITLTPDGDTTRQVTMTLTQAAGVAISAAISDLTHMRERYFRLQQDVNLQARFLQIRIQSSVATQTTTQILASLHSLVLEFNTEGTQGQAAL